MAQTQICQCCGQPIRAKRAKAPTFKGYDDFIPVLQIAKYAAQAARGDHWAIIPGASVMARLPAAWTRCKVFGRISASPRDRRLPAAQFWPDGILPAGPEYAGEYALASSIDYAEAA